MEIDSIEIKELQEFAELREACAIQQEVWGTSDLDVIPPHQLMAVRDAGGTLIGAFEGGRLIGFVYGFAGYEFGRITIHSHLAAVKPEYRNLQIGYRLKLAQRAMAIAKEIDLITWTFDPLQSLNAYFNFARLGVIADIYKVNYYGAETSILLPGLGTDRFWVKWELESRRVQRRLSSVQPLSETELPSDALTLIGIDENDAPQRLDLAPQIQQIRRPLLIEIPEKIGDLQARRPQLAIEWRGATRMAFTEALAAGYIVVDFFRRKSGGRQIGIYLLKEL